MRYGVIPAGGLGTRMRHLGFSKELVRIGGVPVIEYVIERLKQAGITRIFITSHEDKNDLNEYVSQESPNKGSLELLLGERKGLLDGIVKPAIAANPTDQFYFGLPDTVWYPESGFASLDKASGPLVLGLLPSDTPSLYGSVDLGLDNSIVQISEKPAHPTSPWIWAFGRFDATIASRLLEIASSANPPLVFTEVLGAYCREFGGIGVTFQDGRYLDIGIPSNLVSAEEFIK